MNSEDIHLKEESSYPNKLRSSFHLSFKCIQECHLSFFKKLGSKPCCFYSKTIVLCVCMFTCEHRGQGRVERSSMRHYASTHLKKYNKMKISTGKEHKWTNIARCVETEIPIQMLRSAKMQFLQSSAFLCTCLNFWCMINNHRWYQPLKLQLPLVLITPKKSNPNINRLTK